jgi:hypothetical protein
MKLLKLVFLENCHQPKLSSKTIIFDIITFGEKAGYDTHCTMLTTQKI